MCHYEAREAQYAGHTHVCVCVCVCDSVHGERVCMYVFHRNFNFHIVYDEKNIFGGQHSLQTNTFIYSKQIHI